MSTRKTALGVTIASLTAALCAVAAPGSASAQTSLPSSRLTFGQAVSGAIPTSSTVRPATSRRR